MPTTKAEEDPERAYDQPLSKEGLQRWGWRTEPGRERAFSHVAGTWRSINLYTSAAPHSATEDPGGKAQQ